MSKVNDLETHFYSFLTPILIIRLSAALKTFACSFNKFFSHAIHDNNRGLPNKNRWLMWYWYEKLTGITFVINGLYKKYGNEKVTTW